VWNQESASGSGRSRRVALLAGATILVVVLVIAVVIGWTGAAADRGSLAPLPAGICPAGSTSDPRAADGCPAGQALTAVQLGTCPHPSAPPSVSASSSPATGGCPGGLSPSPPSSAHPSTTPSKSRPAAPPVPPVRKGGKPGTSNTGVPAGTKLTVVTGTQTYSKANQVISGLDIHGFVQIHAKNVTIKNSIIRGGSNPPCNSAVVNISDGGSATIEDSEIDPSDPSPCLDGIWAANAKLLRMNIHGAVDGVKAFDNVTIEDSYLHDMSWFASDPNQGGGPTHNDAVQTFEGNSHITLRHNTMSPGAKGNAAYQVSQDGGKVATDLHIDGNWLDGGGCTLNFAHQGGPTPMTGIYVTNNRFGRNSTFDCPILISTKTVLSQNSGNVWDNTGKAIPKPQQHD
jgi:hypothetical protein